MQTAEVSICCHVVRTVSLLTSYTLLHASTRSTGADLNYQYSSCCVSWQISCLSIAYRSMQCRHPGRGVTPCLTQSYAQRQLLALLQTYMCNQVLLLCIPANLYAQPGTALAYSCRLHWSIWCQCPGICHATFCQPFWVTFQICLLLVRCWFRAESLRCNAVKR